MAEIDVAVARDVVAAGQIVVDLDDVGPGEPVGVEEVAEVAPQILGWPAKSSGIERSPATPTWPALCTMRDPGGMATAWEYCEKGGAMLAGL